MGSRKPAEFKRVYHSVPRVEFVKALPCCVCFRRRGSENHHVRNGGMGRKAGYSTIVPLCFECHERYHRIGKLSLLQWVRKRWGGLRLPDPRYPVSATGRRVVTVDQWDTAAEVVEDLWRRRQR